MGAWGDGLFENDTAAEVRDEITQAAFAEIAKHDGAQLGPKHAGPLAAQLALIAYYDDGLFEEGTGNFEEDEPITLHRAIERNRAVLLQVAPKAEPLLDRLLAVKLDESLGVSVLLGAKHARGYLQVVADQCVDQVDDRDTIEEATAVYLDVLALISPYVEVSHKRVRHWAKRVRSNDLRACKKILIASSNADSDGDDDDD